MRIRNTLAVVLSAAWMAPAVADSTEARCDIYPAGSDHAAKMIACTFSQRQGYVTITREDGVTHDLSPVGDAPGNYRDQQGRPVYRQSGLGDQGLIFRLPDESVFVYWSTAALHPENDADNREAEAKLEGDTWTVTIDGSDVYEVPLAAIEGG